MVDREETAFVYTLSSRKGMVQQALRSIATLKQHVDVEKINIFYTPPYDEEDEKALKETGANVVKKENQTEAFNVSRSLPESHYGEKINLCSLEEKNVVFLDCDTIVGNNIWEVLEGDFEFKARPAHRFNDDKDWKKMFDERDRPYLDWMPNAGFLVFKEGAHRKIQDDWANLVSQDLEFQMGKVDHHEQYALALTISDLKIHEMKKKEHVFEWKDEKVADAYIYHVAHSAGSSIMNVVKNYLGRLKP
ncbi:hypothetical protein GKQ38_04540 [Candidatus Nanohaloarchaea archaeon]|nr:hypothetical protein GKQ38_04540 [Candidatus Nanohaloarchaea archaeon]